MIDIPAPHLETIKKILSKIVPGIEVRVFGSRIKGTNRSYSDLDMVLVGDKPISPDVKTNLKDAFEESNIPFRIELIDWHAISGEFRKIIDDKYEVIQKNHAS